MLSCYLVVFHVSVYFFFFFKQKTAYEMRISDWSSDVCSSDLRRCPGCATRRRRPVRRWGIRARREWRALRARHCPWLRRQRYDNPLTHSCATTRLKLWSDFPEEMAVHPVVEQPTLLARARAHRVEYGRHAGRLTSVVHHHRIRHPPPHPLGA